MQTYVRYLKNVLGISAWVRPVSEPGDFNIIFIGESECLPGSPEADIFARIISALKKSADEVGYIATSASELSDVLPNLEAAKHVYCLDHGLGEFLANNFPSVTVHQIPSFADMISKPEKKRQAWDVFKSTLDL